MEGYRHYVRINEFNIIIHGFSSAFEQPQESDILVVESNSRHFHEVWSETLVNNRGQYLFKWINGERIERSQQELDDEYVSIIIPVIKTPEQQRIEQLEAILYKPNPNELFLSLDIANTTLDDLKTKKLEQLDYLCNQEILSGFYSDALGDIYFYNFDPEAQSNINGQLNILNGNLISADENIIWKTDGIPMSHTIEQFKDMCLDAFVHKQNKISKYWTKKYTVLAMTNKEDILSVNWDD